MSKFGTNMSLPCIWQVFPDRCMSRMNSDSQIYVRQLEVSFSFECIFHESFPKAAAAKKTYHLVSLCVVRLLLFAFGQVTNQYLEDILRLIIAYWQHIHLLNSIQSWWHCSQKWCIFNCLLLFYNLIYEHLNWILKKTIIIHSINTILSLISLRSISEA